jgi:hypothetical protein
MMYLVSLKTEKCPIAPPIFTLETPRFFCPFQIILKKN